MREFQAMEKLKGGYVKALINDATFNFNKPEGARSLIRYADFYYDRSRGYVSGGLCPNCGCKTVFFNIDYPWKVKCSRLARCNYNESTETLYPEVVMRIREEHDKCLAKMKNKKSFFSRLLGMSH